MRPLVHALRWALLVSPLLLPMPGWAATSEVAMPLPETEWSEEDVGLSPMPDYVSPTPQLERQAAFVGTVTGNEEYDTYGYRVADEKAAAPEAAR
ncbi:hypothetical protein D9599_12295 [Roseomonas sp. KE2513]|uniref:hypothetical protein n=1 Tax=Roseomonas sp. KE2513 TaxID=2479202 RepID=UPI0018DF7D6B|nr:hypothetical protein [Roseomonas sp. KE2513]MBI0536355.1 hypothetical protein [Roseomonas sp. KE2513]